MDDEVTEIVYDYVIIVDLYMSMFVSMIHASLCDGWKPLGAPFKDGIYWCQAMVKTKTEAVKV